MFNCMYHRLDGGEGCQEDATVECTWNAEKNRGILAVNHHQTRRPTSGRQNLLGWSMARESDKEWECGRCRQVLFPLGIKSVDPHEDDVERAEASVLISAAVYRQNVSPPPLQQLRWQSGAGNIEPLDGEKDMRGKLLLLPQVWTSDSRVSGILHLFKDAWLISWLV